MEGKYLQNILLQTSMFKRRLEHKIKSLEGKKQFDPASKGHRPSLHQQEEPEQQNHAD